MADGSRIEWTEATWNPLVGCTAVSPGCDHCYAAREASGRLSHLPLYAGLASHGVFTGEVRLVEDRLSQPLAWKRPRRIFVNSMSDLFHASVPDDYIARVFQVMSTARQHTFQVLTKRHGRMESLLNSASFGAPVLAPNVWLGVSVEDQHWAGIRIPALERTPAAVRWISAEPLLGPIDLSPWLAWGRAVRHSKDYPTHTLGPFQDCDGNTEIGCDYCSFDTMRGGIDWVVVGGESGPRARPMHPDWARLLRDQCTTAGVPFHFKQWGEWLPYRGHREFLALPPAKLVNREWERPFGDDVTMCRVGKRNAGRVLDGRTWDEYPRETVPV